MKTEDFAYAVSLLREFCSGDRSDFESLEWSLIRT